MLVQALAQLFLLLLLNVGPKLLPKYTGRFWGYCDVQVMHTTMTTICTLLLTMTVILMALAPTPRTSPLTSACGHQIKSHPLCLMLGGVKSKHSKMNLPSTEPVPADRDVFKKK